VSQKDGGQAFPYGSYEHGGSEGMTLRDYFAGQTITGLIDLRVEANCPAIAKRAYEIADAMLAERAK
jgi:hypothetical protein